MKTRIPSFIAAIAAVMTPVTPLEAHNLDTTATSISFAGDFTSVMSQRASLNQPLVTVGDEFWVLLKTTPGPGTVTGVGGYQTFYAPSGIQIIDAAYVFPDASDPRGFRNIPMKGQSPIAVGNGSIGAASSPELVGFVLPGVNGLGFRTDTVTSSGAHRGTLAGVYADTGIFYSTDPRTVFNSYGTPAPPLTGPTMTNNSGDTVGEYFAGNIPNSATRKVLGVMTLWDAQQLRAYGRKDLNPLLDSNGRGTAPWGLANVVPGPQSGYAWEFDAASYDSTSGSDTQKIRAAIKMGPWNRIKYPGSQISSDQPGLISNVLGQAGIDASLMGIDSAAIPANANAVRFAIGQLELGRPEYSAVKVRVGVAPGAGDCKIMNADAFGGDAGGTDGGKDHIWRYFDPTVVSLNPCTFLQKVASKSLVAPGETFYYDITFANIGSVTLPDFTIADALPTGLTHISATPAETSRNGQTLTWQFGTVEAGDFVTIRHYVKATGTGTLFNTATAKSGISVVGVAQTSVEVGVRAILDKDKTVTPSNTAPGGTVTYTLNVENIGTGNNGVPLRVREFLPPGFTYVALQSATLNGATIGSPTIAVDASNGTRPVFTIGQGIQPGKKLVISFTALVGAGVLPGTYWNSFQLEYEGKIVPPIPEAPVTVGGARIGDFVWRDWDNDGVQDAGEEGISGVTVQLFVSNGSTLLRTTSTDPSGMYLFTGLNAGTYVVKVTPPADHAQSFDPDPTVNNETTVALGDSQNFMTADFGYRPSGPGSIGDQVFEDRNKNGIWNSGEPGIPNVTVRLYEDSNGNGTIDSGDLLIATQTTNGSGIYNFTALNTTRSYIVQAATADPDIAGYFTTSYGSSANQLTSTNPRAVASGFTTVTNADFGFWRSLPATIGDQVFADNNFNGVYDVGDSPLGNVSVQLYDSTGAVLLTTVSTNASGVYSLTGLAAGTYVVKVDTLDADIPSGFSSSVLSHPVTVAAGDNHLTADFPFIAVFGKSVDLAAASPGNFLNYTLFPYWPGPSLLTNARVSDTVPAGTTFVSAGQGGGLSGLTGAAAVNGSVAAVAASSGSPSLTSIADVEIWGVNPNTAYGSVDDLWVERSNSGVGRALFRFDLSTIPSNATINSAVLRLTRPEGSGANTTISAHRLNVVWDEATATWNSRNPSNSWSAAGAQGDYNAAAESSKSVSTNGTHDWGLTSLTQGWVNNTFANNGVLLRFVSEATDGAQRFSSKENGTDASRPKLIVNWSVAAVTGTTTAITVSPSSVNDSGAGVNVNVSMTVTATAAVSNIVPSALTVLPGSNGATATLVSGPANSPASIGAGGGSATFTWVYRIFKGTAEDQVRVSGAATGTGAAFASATSNGVVVKDAAATASAAWNLGSNIAALNGAESVSSGGDITFIGNSTDENDVGGNLTLNLPTNTAEGDMLLAAISINQNASDAITAPTGWTLIQNAENGEEVRLAAYRKIATASEPSSYTFIITNAERSLGSISTYRNVLAANPVNADNAQTGATASCVAPSVTTTVPDTRLVAFYNSRGNTAVNTGPSGMTFRYIAQSASVSASRLRITTYDELFAATGATGNRTATLAAAVSNIGALIALTPNPPVSYQTTTAMSVRPALVTDTGGGVDLTVSQTVTATAAVTNITPPTNLTVVGTNGANATKVSGPTNSGANIGAGGGSATFTWVYKVTAGSTPGQVTFACTPAGTGATFAAATSNGVIVTQPLSMRVQVKSPNPGVPFVNNIAQFFNGPTFLAEDNAVTSLSASIGDYVWHDTDGDGVQDSGEFGIGGISVHIYDSVSGNLVGVDITDAAGQYRVFGLAAGSYVVSYDAASVPPGFFGTTPPAVNVSLAAAQQFNNADFGLNTLPAGTGSIGDYVWIDANNDGVQDSGELPLVNVGITLERLINGSWVAVGSAVTDTGGAYHFTGLSAAQYRVTVDTTSQISSPYAQGTFDLGNVMLPTHDRDGIVTPQVALVTLATNSTVVNDTDFGYNWSGGIGDKVWWDYDTDGLQDEIPLVGVPNARVQLYFDKDFDGAFDRILGDYEILRVFTDSNGNYLIPNLPPGNYFVDVYEDSITTNGVRNVVPTTDDIVPVNLSTGNMNLLTADFGYFVGARVEATVYWDVNHNGIRDSEPLLANITVTLTGTDKLGNPVARNAQTDSNGNVVFLVPEGDYTISYNPAQLAGIYPALGTSTTPTGFEFEAVAGEDGLKRFDFGVDNTGAIGDTIYADNNGNGGQEAGEPGLVGVTVNLFFDANGDGAIDYGAGDLLLETAFTDSTGNYNFIGLADTAGGQRYVVESVTATLPSGYQAVATGFPVGANNATSRYATALTGGQAISIVDFGYPLVPATYRSISGTVYNDNGAGGGTDSDGNLNGTEPGLLFVTVTVEVDTDANGSFDQAFTAPTDSSGYYSLGGILQGANVRVTVDTATLPGTAFVQTGDPNGAPLSNVFNIANLQVNRNNLDFGYVEDLGSIAGTVVRGNGNGIAESGEPVFASVPVVLTYAGVDGILGTSDDLVFNTITNQSGDYSFTGLRPGSYQVTTTVPSIYKSLADADGGNPNNISLTLPLGADVTNRDFEYQSGSIGDYVWLDSNGDGVQNALEPPLANVRVYVDINGDDNYDIGEPGATTDSSGLYIIDTLAAGTLSVRVDPATLPLGIVPSYDLDGVGTPHEATIALSPNENRADVDFGYRGNGSITGSVFQDTDANGSGDTGISGVMLSLVDGSGAPIPDSNGQATTTLTAGNGTYSFANLLPGTYGVVETQPANFVSLSDKDGGNLDEIRPITVLAGQPNTLNDFVEISTCPDTWADWKQLHPAETAAGNPEADAYDNLAEFAFAMPYDSGLPSKWLSAGTAWIIRPSSVPGVLEGVFVRPKGAPLNVTYTLQYAADLGNPTAWLEKVIDMSNATFSDNGDCTETVTILDLALTTNLTGGKGVVRIKAELDEVPSTGVDHITYSEVEGWKQTVLGTCCRTYHNPFQQESVFTGTVAAVSGQVLSFTGESLNTLLTPGKPYYLEVTAGDNEGHRFDIVSASGTGITLVSDSNLYGVDAPFSSRTGAPPADLVDDRIAIRSHRTLDDQFPSSAAGFAADRDEADQVKLLISDQWIIYWHYDGVATSTAPRWVKFGDTNFGDQGATILSPGQGMFFDNRHAVSSVLAHGEVRNNRFIRPIAQGTSLVGGGYPLDQSPIGSGSRQMNYSATAGLAFFGSRDLATADSFYVWKGDTVANTNGYDSYFLNVFGTNPAKWIIVGDSGATSQNAAKVLLGDGSVSIRARFPVDTYIIPTPWSADP